jgi:hypothetical protein
MDGDTARGGRIWQGLKSAELATPRANRRLDFENTPASFVGVSNGLRLPNLNNSPGIHSPWMELYRMSPGASTVPAFGLQTTNNTRQ